MSSALRLRDRFLAWLLSWLGWGILQFIGKTSRFQKHFAPGAEELIRSGRPLIYAFWHRYQLLLAYVHRGEGLNVLISRSRDGEFIAKTVQRLGYDPIRGSSSRGGGAALLEVLTVLEQGKRRHHEQGRGKGATPYFQKPPASSRGKSQTGQGKSGPLVFFRASPGAKPEVRDLPQGI